MKVKIIKPYYDKELDKTFGQEDVDKGTVIEINQARYSVLSGNNAYKTAFVEKVKEVIEVEDTKAEPVVEKAVKKTTRKKKAE